MLTLYADESYDDHTYALGGWLATPTHYRLFEAEWKAMLSTITMPNGSSCSAFHAKDIMDQRRAFKGWGKEQAFSAFHQATNVLVNRPGRFALWPCAVATEIPASVKGQDKDAVWLLLFMKFFALVMQTFPAAAGITFVFDKKDDIEKIARSSYAKVQNALASAYPNVLLEHMAFVEDESCAGVQAADLLLYEWRKRLTAQRLKPEWVDSRPWFQKIREARPDGALVRIDVEKHIRERDTRLRDAARTQRMLFGEEIGRD